MHTDANRTSSNNPINVLSESHFGHSKMENDTSSDDSLRIFFFSVVNCFIIFNLFIIINLMLRDSAWSSPYIMSYGQYHLWFEIDSYYDYGGDFQN